MYEPVIGLEIHSQISTKTKMFCRCDNNSFGKSPNINICPICMGHPGQLPVLNKEALRKGVIAAIALNCDILEFSKFDRKNYFYPDLPKGFQISQFDEPISKDGYLEIEVAGKIKKVGITRLHLEDDAGKLIHEGGSSLCDYNRSGTPLMEIVSEPELFSVEEASVFAQELQKVIRYVGSSDCDMEKGMMRFDINVSLRKKGETKLGTRAEVKNLNSFKNLEKALRYEIKRQSEILDEGGRVIQETRGFDLEKGITISQRVKEEANDYRYFPEPDLPPVVVSKKEVESLRKLIPELPLKKRHRFIKNFSISEDEARILSDNFDLSCFYEEVVEVSGNSKKASSLITSVLMEFMNKDLIKISESKVKPEELGALIKLIDGGDISNSVGKEVLAKMYKTGLSPNEIVEKEGLKQMSDEGELDLICSKVVEAHPDIIEKIKEGNTNVFGFLVGQVMKETKGQANPGLVNKILKKKIS